MKGWIFVITLIRRGGCRKGGAARIFVADQFFHILGCHPPAYNEENGIVDIMQHVLAVRPALRAAGIPELELIVVDDGSHRPPRSCAPSRKYA